MIWSSGQEKDEGLHRWINYVKDDYLAHCTWTTELTTDWGRTQQLNYEEGKSALSVRGFSIKYGLIFEKIQYPFNTQHSRILQFPLHTSFCSHSAVSTVTLKRFRSSQKVPGRGVVWYSLRQPLKSARWIHFRNDLAKANQFCYQTEWLSGFMRTIANVIWQSMALLRFWHMTQRIT